MDHPDAGRDRIGGAVRRVRIAVEAPRSRVLRKRARDDVRERRLTGAVLAKHADDLAVVDIEVDILQRDDARKALRQALTDEASSRRFFRSRPRAHTRFHRHSFPPAAWSETPSLRRPGWLSVYTPAATTSSLTRESRRRACRGFESRLSGFCHP